MSTCKNVEERGYIATRCNEYLLTVKIMFRMAWRAVIGFAGSILRNIFGEGISVPNYAHASRLY